MPKGKLILSQLLLKNHFNHFQHFECVCVSDVTENYYKRWKSILWQISQRRNLIKPRSTFLFSQKNLYWSNSKDSSFPFPFLSLPQSNQLSPRIFWCSPPSNDAAAFFSQKTWSQPHLQTLKAVFSPLRAYVSIFQQRRNVPRCARIHYTVVYSN